MVYFPEIANYWSWHLERMKWIGLICQVLGIFAFFALWWHQDRGWKVLKWVFSGYLAILALSRFLLWLLYGLLSSSPTPSMQAFIIRSGMTGFALCLLLIFWLLLDIKTFRVQFDFFGPEAWNRSRPSLRQWLALLLSFFVLWFPFVPKPGSSIGSLYTWGFPTSFGLTLTPFVLWLMSLLIAGSKQPSKASLIFLSIAAILSALVVDPVTFHGIIVAALGTYVIFTSTYKKFSG